MKDTNPCISLHLTCDEFFILVSILHQVNRNIKADESGAYRSHAVFQFAGDCSGLTGAVHSGYNTFRSLTGKVYDINLRKARAGLEDWR